MLNKKPRHGEKYTLLYSTILYYTILYYTILYYAILYYSILYLYSIVYYNILVIIEYSIRYSNTVVSKYVTEAKWKAERYIDLGMTPHHLHISNCDQPDINFQVIGTTYSVIVNSISRDMILIIYQKCFRKKLKSLCE